MPYDRFVLARALALAAALAIAPSCSDDDGGGTSVDQACEQVARALCDKLSSCSPITVEVTFGQVDLCVDAGKPGCVAALGAPDVNPGITSHASGCAASINNMACDLAMSPDVVCASLPGERADGSSCAVSLQCRSSYCKGAQPGECGVCAVRAKSGEACEEDDGCEDGTRCNIAGKCYAPVAKAGGDCATAMMCAGTLVCQGGVCVEPVGEGADCGAQRPPCSPMLGLYCDPGTSKCKQVDVAKAGESCGMTTACTVGSGCHGGKCTANAKAGESCDYIDGPSCEPGTECVKGTCKTPSVGACP